MEFDPQLVCYSWATQAQQVCLLSFAHKAAGDSLPAGKHPQAQWRAFAQTLHLLASEMEPGHFYPHSGIRYPNNQRLNCAYPGRRLRKKVLVEERLVKVEKPAVS